MTSTEKLGFNIPAGTDWADIKKINENFQKLDDILGDKETTVTVYADEGSTVTLLHKSGLYDAEVKNGEASFVLPSGGHVVCKYDYHKQTINRDMVLEGGEDARIMTSLTKVHISKYCEIPNGYFDGTNDHENCPLVIDGTVRLIQKLSAEDIETVKSGYSGAFGQKSDLWQMVRCGMISQSVYEEITKENYPSDPVVEYANI